PNESRRNGSNAATHTRHSGRGEAAIRLRLQDRKRERHRRPKGRAPWMARVNPAPLLFVQKSLGSGFRATRVPGMTKGMDLKEKDVDAFHLDAMAMGILAAGVHRGGGGAVRIGHAPDGRATSRDPRPLARRVVPRRTRIAVRGADVAAGHPVRRTVFRAHAAAHVPAAGDSAVASVWQAGDHLAVGVRRQEPACDRAWMEARRRYHVPLPDAPAVRVDVAQRGAVLLAPARAVRCSIAPRMAARSGARQLSRVLAAVLDAGDRALWAAARAGLRRYRDLRGVVRIRDGHDRRGADFRTGAAVRRLPAHHAGIWPDTGPGPASGRHRDVDPLEPGARRRLVHGVLRVVP